MDSQAASGGGGTARGGICELVVAAMSPKGCGGRWYPVEAGTVTCSEAKCCWLAVAGTERLEQPRRSDGVWIHRTELTYGAELSVADMD